MKAILLLLCLTLGRLTAAEPPVPPPAVERLQRETIPHFKLDGVPVDDALKTLKAEWTRQHPGESFPVSLVVSNGLNPPKITLDLKHVPFWVALKACGDSIGFATHDAGEVIRLDTDYSELDDTMATNVFPVSATLLTALGMKADGSHQRADPWLRKFGITFGESDAANLSPDGKSVTVRTTRAQLRLIPGVLHLLEQGFTVERRK